MKKYIIDEKALLELLDESAMLNALQLGGVDNWDWYGDALSDQGYDDYEAAEQLKNYEIYKGE